MASFEPTPSNDLVLIGDASIDSGSAIQLNRGARNSSGGALYHKAMQLWEVSDSATTKVADFSTHFSFNINSSVSFHGDGVISFLLLPPGYNSNGYAGLFGALNYSSAAAADDDDDQDRESQVVAVEFDTGLDPISDQFGICVNSSIMRSGNYVNVSRSGFVNTGTANVWVNYDSKSKNLSASLGFSGNLGSYHVSYTVDLSVVLPEKVQIGFTASTGASGYVEIHQVLSWSFSSSLLEEEEISIVKVMGLRTILLAVVVVVVVLILVIGVMIAIWRWKSRRSNENSSDCDGILIETYMAAPREFAYSTLSKATNNFAEESKIGEGGFGCVYKGRLTDPEMDVAIKALKRGSGQGKKEFLAEIKVISKIRHKNLVRLIGWCEEGEELVLVYEFQPNGSLDTHLYSVRGEGDNNNLLDWATLYRIACGLASGLQYLHDGLDQCVVHRDIKPGNIMLDSDFNTKLGDFGLARFVDLDRSLNSTALAGTRGYMDPDLLQSLNASSKSDVYSFGVVALEIVTGIRATELGQMIRGLHIEADYGTTLNYRVEVDKRLTIGSDFDEDEASCLKEVGFRCCNPISESRPSMTQVTAALKHRNAAFVALEVGGAASSSHYQRIASAYRTPGQSFQEPENVGF